MSILGDLLQRCLRTSATPQALRLRRQGRTIASRTVSRLVPCGAQRHAASAPSMPSTPFGEAGSGPRNLINFGKHRGRSYEDVQNNEPGYCTWVLEKANSDDPSTGPDMRKFALYLRSSTSPPRASRSPESGIQTPWSTSPPRTSRSPESGVQKSWSTPPRTPSSSAYGIQKSWSTPPRASQSRASVISGAALLETSGEGKHEGRSYADIFTQDQNYCKWLVTTMMDKTPANMVKYWPLVAYIQYRWLQGDLGPPQKLSVDGHPRCLEGQSFVITGCTSEMPRFALKTCIEFFAGRVPGALSSKTTALVVGTGTIDGSPVEQSKKFREATQRGLPIISVQQLLDHIAQSADTENVTTFNYDGTLGEEE